MDNQDNNKSNNNDNRGNRRRRPSRNHHRRRKPGTNQEGKQSEDAQKASPNKSRHGKSHRSNKNRNRNRNRSNKQASGPITKYYELLDKHNTAREKYYEKYHRADPRQKAKLERIFYQTLKDLRDYEEKAEGQQKAELIAHKERYKVDNTYSTNHELPFEAEPVPFDQEFDDVHLLESQINRDNYKEDEEESVGTMADYLSYKGLQ